MKKASMGAERFLRRWDGAEGDFMKVGDQLELLYEECLELGRSAEATLGGLSGRGASGVMASATRAAEGSRHLLERWSETARVFSDRLEKGWRTLDSCRRSFLELEKTVLYVKLLAQTAYTEATRSKTLTVERLSQMREIRGWAEDMARNSRVAAEILERFEKEQMLAGGKLPGIVDSLLKLEDRTERLHGRIVEETERVRERAGKLLEELKRRSNLMQERISDIVVEMQFHDGTMQSLAAASGAGRAVSEDEACRCRMRSERLGRKVAEVHRAMAGAFEGVGREALLWDRSFSALAASMEPDDRGPDREPPGAPLARLFYFLEWMEAFTLQAGGLVKHACRMASGSAREWRSVKGRMERLRWQPSPLPSELSDALKEGCRALGKERTMEALALQLSRLSFQCRRSLARLEEAARAVEEAPATNEVFSPPGEDAPAFRREERDFLEKAFRELGVELWNLSEKCFETLNCAGKLRETAFHSRRLLSFLSRLEEELKENEGDMKEMEEAGRGRKGLSREVSGPAIEWFESSTRH